MEKTFELSSIHESERQQARRVKSLPIQNHRKRKMYISKPVIYMQISVI